MLGDRILVIGCAGSGKTTLTYQLHEKLGIPVIHLDKFFWSDNWKAPEHQQWEKEVERLAQNPEWIMDGNYTTSLPLRLDNATSVIYLDVPRWKCLIRVIFRRFRWLHNKKRQDMAAGCKEHLNWRFYRWVWDYPKRSRGKTLAMLACFKGPVYVLRTNKDFRNFISKVSNDTLNAE